MWSGSSLEVLPDEQVPLADSGFVSLMVPKSTPSKPMLVILPGRI